MKKQLITLSALVGGFILGASALVALAAGSTWSAPHQTPPNCDPALDSGCNAPLNVGSVSQSKLGQLLVNTGGAASSNGLSVFGTAIFNNGIKIPTGAGLYKILADVDGSGTAQWVATSSLGLGGSGSSDGSSGVSKIIAGTNVTISPTTGVGDVTINSNITATTHTMYSQGSPDNGVKYSGTANLAAYKFCAVSQSIQKDNASDAGREGCAVIKNANGTWTQYMYVSEVQTYDVCAVTCF